MSEEVKSWFLNIANNEQQVFLALLSNELTIHGRYFGSDDAEGTLEQKVQAFKGLNELHHQISQHIAHLIENAARYPDDVLWAILQEKAKAYGISKHLNSSIERARSHCKFEPVSKAVH